MLQMKLQFCCVMIRQMTGRVKHKEVSIFQRGIKKHVSSEADNQIGHEEEMVHMRNKFQVASHTKHTTTSME